MARLHAKYTFKAPPDPAGGTVTRRVTFVPDDTFPGFVVDVPADTPSAEVDLDAELHVSATFVDVDQAGNASIPSATTPGTSTVDVPDTKGPPQPDEGTLDLTTVAA